MYLQISICTTYFHMHTCIVVPQAKFPCVWSQLKHQNGSIISIQVSTPNPKLAGLSDQHTSLLC